MSAVRTNSRAKLLRRPACPKPPNAPATSRERRAFPGAPRCKSLDPGVFTSLGASPFAVDGTYTINASKDLANPVLIGADGMTTLATGIFHSPSGGAAATDEIAVFTFNSKPNY